MLSANAADIKRSHGPPFAESHDKYSHGVLTVQLFLVPDWRILNMAKVKVNISTMDVQSLMELRGQIDERLTQYRAEIEKQLEEMDRAIGGERPTRGRGQGSELKGRKVAPKYRGPGAETWAGRGARPRWLVAAIKEGKKLEDFLIEKSAQGRHKKRRAKR